MIFDRFQPMDSSSVSEDMLDFASTDDAAPLRGWHGRDLFVLRGTGPTAGGSRRTEDSGDVRDTLDLEEVSGADWTAAMGDRRRASAGKDGEAVLVLVDEIKPICK